MRVASPSREGQSNQKRGDDTVYKVIVQSINEYNEVEWEEEITSERSLRGAMSKATKWIKKQLFSDVIVEKSKPLTKWSKQVTWRVC